MAKPVPFYADSTAQGIIGDTAAVMDGLSPEVRTMIGVASAAIGDGDGTRDQLSFIRQRDALQLVCWLAFIGFMVLEDSRNGAIGNG